MTAIGIMQPYFFPYIGYWQLINAVDKFVVYDNIQYTKKGWINRNYYLLNGQKTLFTVNIEKASDYLDICERLISSEYKRDKLVVRLQSAYKGAPMYGEVFDLVANIIRFSSCNLFEYIVNSIVQVCAYLGIRTEIIVSSSLNNEPFLKSEERVIAFCKELGGHTYINAIGGMELYSRAHFAKENLMLRFLEAQPIEYKQWGGEFVPWLSVIDLMMFNSKEQLSQMLNKYELLDGV